MTEKNRLMRQLPKVDEMIRIMSARRCSQAPDSVIKTSVQQEIGQARQRILSGETDLFSYEDLTDRIEAEIARQSRPHLQKVINATGVVLHTNLGRARLSNEICHQLGDIAGGYSNLEYNLEDGVRGSRYDHVETLLTRLTGAEAALVVNNNAAAVYLMLSSVFGGREVIVSRGELVEIGGSFRVPEIMKAGGCRLVEVGTTNKTHVSDYETAISDQTGGLLKVHTSNYKIIGFTEDVSLRQLRQIGDRHNLPVIYDMGSGLLLDLQEHGIGKEPTVRQCIEAQADLVSFSGDKLLGGPQAGIIVGKAEYINKMKKNHLLRALRIDKLTLTALELTLREYLDPSMATARIPTLRMLLAGAELLAEKAGRLHAMLTPQEDRKYAVTAVNSQVGGGSMPGVELPSYAVSVVMSGVSADRIEQQLRAYQVPIISRIVKDQILLDVRTIEDEELGIIAAFFNNYEVKGDTK